MSLQERLDILERTAAERIARTPVFALVIAPETRTGQLCHAREAEHFDITGTHNSGSWQLARLRGTAGLSLAIDVLAPRAFITLRPDPYLANAIKGDSLSALADRTETHIRKIASGADPVLADLLADLRAAGSNHGRLALRARTQPGDIEILPFG